MLDWIMIYKLKEPTLHLWDLKTNLLKFPVQRNYIRNETGLCECVCVCVLSFSHRLEADSTQSSAACHLG